MDLQRKPTAAQPAQALKQAEEIRERAGLTIPRQAALVAKAARVADEAMDATKVEYFTSLGRVTDERTVIDHATRLAGSDRALDITGAKPAKSAADKGSGPIIYVVNAPAVYVPKPRRQVEVIDVTPLPSA